MSADELEYGAIVPGVTCPACGSELVHTSNGAFCEWDTAYVPIVDSAVLVHDDEDDPDWIDDEDAP